MFSKAYLIMFISNFTLVNQKLAFARSILALTAQNSMAVDSGARRLQQDALLSSVAFQLRLAFHFYLREIADRVHLKNVAAIESLSDLKSALEQGGRFLLEVDELLNLSLADGSWLAELNRYAEYLFASPQKQKEQKAFVDDNQIAIVDLTSVDEFQAFILNQVTVELWLTEFCALVMRHRETGAEF